MALIQSFKSNINESLKCPYNMKPIGVCVHNSDNDATAREEIENMQNNNKQVSFHVAIDDIEAIQGIPFNKNAWHAGDDLTGDGNRKHIAVEICWSKSGGDKFISAEKRAAKEIASILREYNWGINAVKRHKDFSGKNCPDRTMKMGWQRFLNMISEELENNGLEIPKNLPKFSTYNFTSTDVYDKLSDMGQLKGLTFYCIPELFVSDEKKTDGEDYDDITGDAGNIRDFYDPNAYTIDSVKLIKEKDLCSGTGYHMFVDGESIINVIPPKKIVKHLKGTDDTYINKNLYNNKANENSAALVMLMPKGVNYKKIENMAAKYIATFLLENALSRDYFMRSFDLNKTPSPLHFLDKTMWRKFVKKVDNYYSAIRNGKYTDKDLKDLDNTEPIMSDSAVRQFYFKHKNDFNEYSKDYEVDDRGIDRITNPENPDNLSNTPDEISSFESANNVTFAYTISQKQSQIKDHCASPYDSMVVKATPAVLEVEPIYPDIIVPPGTTITLVENLAESSPNVDSGVTLSADELEKRQKTFNIKDYKTAKKEILGKPVNNNDPFPVDDKISELESHTPKVKIDEVDYKMLECNHPGSKLAADVSRDLGMIQDQIITISKRTERRLVKIENTLSTVMRNLFRVASRAQINCVYYGGQDVYGKYKSIRCLCDDRINDGQSMTLDQCLSCTRYEPIIGQVYAILDETGTNISQVLDDAQMAYMDLEDYINLTRIEEMHTEKPYADITENIEEIPSTLKDSWEEGFKMNWTNVSLETQKPNIAEYRAEGMEVVKPTIISPDNQPQKKVEFEDKRESNSAYEELKFSSADYSFGRFTNKVESVQGGFGLGASEIRNKIVDFAGKVLDRCLKGTAGYSQASRKQEIGGILYHDCSSLVAAAYMEGGISFGNTTFDQYPMCYSSAGGKLWTITKQEDAIPGDAIFFATYPNSPADFGFPENPDTLPASSVSNIGHVALYVGNGEMIEAITDEVPLTQQIRKSTIANSKNVYCFARPKALVDADTEAAKTSISAGDDSYWNTTFHNISGDLLETAMANANPDAMKSNVEQYKYKDILLSKAKEHGYDPYMLLGIIGTESGGNPTAGNSAYVGLMGTSINITTASADSSSMTQAIENGCMVLKQKSNTMANFGYPDDICLAIYSYNAGEGNVINALKELNMPKGVPVKAGDIASKLGEVCQRDYGWSYSEKREYFAKVLARYIEYKNAKILG